MLSILRFPRSWFSDWRVVVDIAVAVQEDIHTDTVRPADRLQDRREYRTAPRMPDVEHRRGSHVGTRGWQWRWRQKYRSGCDRLCLNSIGAKTTYRTCIGAVVHWIFTLESRRPSTSWVLVVTLYYINCACTRPSLRHRPPPLQSKCTTSQSVEIAPSPLFTVVALSQPYVQHCSQISIAREQLR